MGKIIPVAPIVKGINAANSPLAQPKGSIPRASNRLFTQRGSTVTCDGSGVIFAFKGIVQTTPQGPFLAVFLYQPANAQPYYVAIQLDKNDPLGAPTGLTAVLASGGSLTVGQQYFYKVTALDGFYSDETVPSSEASATPTSGNQKIQLNWTTKANASGYNVYRGTVSGQETFLTTVSSNSFLDDGSLANGMQTTNIASSPTGIEVLSGGLVLVTTTAPSGIASGQLASFTGTSITALNGLSYPVYATVNADSFYINQDSTLSAFSSSGTAVSSGSGPAWANPSNCFSASLTATITTSGTSSGQILTISNLGFSIPSGATITGMQMTFSASRSPSGASALTLLVGVSNTGQGGQFDLFSSSLTPFTLGGPGFVFGSPTPSAINSPSFNFTFQEGGIFGGGFFTGTLSLNNVFVTIFYTVSIGMQGTTGGGGTVSYATGPLPTSDTTGQVVFRKMPATLSYDESTIVATLPGGSGTTNLPSGGGNTGGSTGGGGGTGGGTGGSGGGKRPTL